MKITILNLGILLVFTITWIFVNADGILAVRQTQFDGLLRNSSMVFWREWVSSATSCAMHCFSQWNCISYFYNTEGHWCQGHFVRFISPNIGAVTTASPSTYYFYIPQEWCSNPAYINHRSLDLCYQHHPASDLSPTRNHQAALDYCINKGERLISHLNRPQLTHLLEQLTNIDINKPFIDGTDEGTDGTWYYSNGDLMTVFDWGPGEPEENDIKERFVALGTWDRIAMTDHGNGRLDFICQKIKQI